MENETIFFVYGGFLDEPYTTSEVIAERAGVDRHDIQALVQKYESDFAEFGPVKFEMVPLPTCGSIQNEKVYFLNEPQATLLVLYLDNTPKAVALKEEFVRRMHDMRKSLEEYQ